MVYNWQQKDWPKFIYKSDGYEKLLLTFSEQMAGLAGALKVLPKDVQTEAIIDTMVAEAIKTSEIEGEYINRQDVKSSIRNRLGLNQVPEKVTNKKAIGLGELMIDVRNTFAEPLTKEKLFAWHKLLFPLGTGITIGTWRTHKEPMQVISGAMGKEKVHFEAPPSSVVPKEMNRFIKWFNETAPGQKKEIVSAPVRAAIAHLYFESIHPFEDGNGRIGRAISEKAISQGVGAPVLLSLSKTIEKNKKEYYLALEKASISNEISAWIRYFIQVIIDAQKNTENLIDFILHKTRFFDAHQKTLNERQLKVIKRMLDEGHGSFEGGMNAQKYISITKTSKPTATRDLQDLAEIGVFRIIGKGRSTRYELIL